MTAPECFLDGKVVLHAGDCLDVMPTLAANSIDSCVCDPPYGLGFMGKAWDHGVPGIPYWKAVYRVLKPGGHLVAFGGTRTYHRMACAIEDAGFEIRECLFYHYGSGFPKSHNVGKQLDASEKRCSCDPCLRDLQARVEAPDPLSGGQKQDVFAAVLGNKHQPQENGGAIAAQSPRNGKLCAVRDDEGDTKGLGASEGAEELLLQSILPRQDGVGTCVDASLPQGPSGVDCTKHGIISNQDDRPHQPGMEGRGDVSPPAGKLREREIRPMPAGLADDGASGWLRDGASLGDGDVDQTTAAAGRVCAPSGSPAAEQSQDESGTVAGQPEPQKRGAWDHCGRCGKPIVPDGLGTALKPATEPIVLARKPLIGSVADNVLAHGTGALNIDGCRVATGDDMDRGIRKTALGMMNDDAWQPKEVAAPGSPLGRWPANVIHDGSDEVVGAFPDTTTGGRVQRAGDIEVSNWRTNEGRDDPKVRSDYSREGDTGSAARFFYTAKADQDDRLGSKHPTVKPLDLMQWLVRLVTPPGGTCLDPFSGTGTTGEAAWREGFKAVLIEREAEYQNDIRRRMALCLSGPEERKRESIKARTKDVPRDDGPLFSGSDTPPTGQADRFTESSRTNNRADGAEVVRP